MIDNDHLSIRQLISQLNFPHAPSTVHCFLHHSGYLAALKVSALTIQHKNRRAQWADKMIIDMSLRNIELNNITFSDGKRFLLDGPECY